MAVEAKWTLNLFGPPRLIDSAGREANLPKKAFVLALRLMLESPQMRLDRDSAAEFLWPARDLDGRRANLRTLVRRIRGEQEAAGAFALSIDEKTLSFDAEAVACDAFAAFAAVRTENDVELARLAPSANRPLLEGCDAEVRERTVWLRDLRARFVADFSRLARRRLAAPTLADDPEICRRLALGLIALDPCDEDAHRALMSLAAERGDAAEALATYDNFANLLKRRHGLRPSPETAALRNRLAELPSAQANPNPVAPEVVWLRQERSTPLLLVPTHPLFGLGADPRLFPRLGENLAEQLRKVRSVRIAVCDSATPAPDLAAQDVYRIQLSLRGAATTQATVRLSWEATGEIVWAHSHSLTPESVDAILSLVAATTLAKIERHQIELSVGAAENDLSTFLLLAKADRNLMSADLPSIRRARRRFREVWRTDPQSARAYAGGARSFWLEWLMRAGPDSALLATAEDLARRAVEVDPDDPRGHRELGMVASYRRRHDEALASLSRAIALAPDSPALRYDYADALISSGARAQAMREIEAADRIGGPADDIAGWIISTGLYLTGQYGAALARLATMQFQDSAWRLRLVCHAMLGQPDEMRRAVAKALEFQPDFNPEVWARICPITDRIDRDHIRDGLRRAGLG